MRETRLSGLEGGGADIRSPYPYPSEGRTRHSVRTAPIHG